MKITDDEINFILDDADSFAYEIILGEYKKSRFQDIESFFWNKENRRSSPYFIIENYY